MAESTLKIILEAVDKNTKKVAKETGASFKALGGAAAKLATGGLALVGVGLAAIGTAAAAAGKASLEFGNETNDAMRSLQATTKSTDEEMVDLKASSLDLFKVGLGENIGEAASAMGDVSRATDLVGDALEDTTADALAFKSVFGEEVAGSIKAADVATQSFGDTQGQVFDLMSRTIQETGDLTGDLVETVGEFSPVFADAGFNANQMFTIFKQGSDAGAKDFDRVANIVLELNDKLKNGSKTTEDALNEMFNAVGEGNADLELFTGQLELAEASLDKNVRALESAEGAYAASAGAVEELEAALEGARRELQGLSRPNLVGMQQFEDQMNALELQGRQAELALLSLEEGTPEFEAGQAGLDAINMQIDRLALERDIQIEPQLQAIDAAIRAGSDSAVTFDDAMAQIAGKQTEIAGLEGSLALAGAAADASAAQVATLKDAQGLLIGNIDALKISIDEADSPAREFLAGFEDGSLTTADAMGPIIERLKAIEDETLQAQIGTALFGTTWVDNTAQVVLALDATAEGIADVDGATQEAFEASKTMTDGAGDLWREFLVAMEPAAQEILPLFNDGLELARDFMTEAAPIFADFATDLQDNLRPALLVIGDSVLRIAEAMGLADENTSGLDASLGLLQGTLDLIVTSIQAVAVVFDAVADVVEGVERRINDLFGPMRTLEDRMKAFIELTTPLGLLSDLSGGQIALPTFHDGGIVAGPTGSPQPIMALGGERVQTIAQQQAIAPARSSGMNIGSITIQANDAAGGAEAADAFISRMQQSGMGVNL